MITRFFFEGKGHRKTKAHQVGSLGALHRTGAVGSGGEILLDRSSSKVHFEKKSGPPDDGIYKNLGRLFG